MDAIKRDEIARKLKEKLHTNESLNRESTVQPQEQIKKEEIEKEQILKDIKKQKIQEEQKQKVVATNEQPVEPDQQVKDGKVFKPLEPIASFLPENIPIRKMDKTLVDFIKSGDYKLYQYVAITNSLMIRYLSTYFVFLSKNSEFKKDLESLATYKGNLSYEAFDKIWVKYLEPVFARRAKDGYVLNDTFRSVVVSEVNSGNIDFDLRRSQNAYFTASLDSVIRDCLDRSIDDATNYSYENIVNYFIVPLKNKLIEFRDSTILSLIADAVQRFCPTLKNESLTKEQAQYLLSHTNLSKDFIYSLNKFEASAIISKQIEIEEAEKHPQIGDEGR
ncbi:MAG: hypothetical protein QXE51_00175 [Nitrososphaeria archaeon]